MAQGKKRKVVICTPTVTRPYDAYLEAVEASVPALEAAGLEHYMVSEVGNPYISAARSIMLRKALDARADVVVFIDHDLSWRPDDLVRLIQSDAHVVAGTYRFTLPDDRVEYMGSIATNPDGSVRVREDGLIYADMVPAGFLKVTKEAVADLMADYPELVYGPVYSPSIDLFQHGAHKGMWWGEDYAFSRRWIESGHDLFILPDLSLTHHRPGGSWPGNLHEHLMGLANGDRSNAGQ